MKSSPETYENKAIECIAVAETIENPKQKAAMLQVASWWRRLAQYAPGGLKAPKPD